MLRRVGEGPGGGFRGVGGAWPAGAGSGPGDGNRGFGKLELMMISDFQKINFYVLGKEFIFRFP